MLFTDGLDNSSRWSNEKDTLELAKESRATIYCVCYDTQRDLPGRGILDDGYPSTPIVMRAREYLYKLAEYSGGVVFDGSQNLTNAFEQVAKELTSQYSIGYYSSKSENDGEYRKVKVKVSKPGLAARTKKGYYPKKEKTDPQR